MVRSHPFKLIVAALLLLLAGLAGMWLSVLPAHLLSKAAARLSDESGLVLEGERPRLRFLNGLSLEAESVGLESRDTDTVSATARLARFSIGWSSLFGSTPQISRADLEAPVITVNVGANRSWSSALQQLTFRDGTLRLKDDRLKTIISLADVNGNWTTQTDGTSALQLTYLADKSLMRLSADIESADRFFGDGSPSDITLTGKNVTMAFSGRAGLASGLQLDGQLNVEASGLAPLAQLLGLGLHSAHIQPAVSMSSGLSLSGLSASLNALQGKFGSATLTGQLGLTPGVDRILINGALNATSLSLLEPLSPLASAWDDAPLALFDLTTFDSDLTLKADAMTLRGQAMGPAAIALTTRDGKGELSVTADGFAGGTFSTTLTLLRDGLAGKVSAKGTEASAALQALLGLSWLAGPVDMAMDFKGNGQSIISLIGSLTGNVSFTSPSLAIDGFDASTLKDANATWQWSSGKASQGLKLTLQGSMVDGIVTLSTAEVAAPGLAAKLTGEIDLLRQHLALAFAPKSKGVAEGLALQGPWHSPILSVGAPSALRPTKDAGQAAPAATPPAD